MLHARRGRKGGRKGKRDRRRDREEKTEGAIIKNGKVSTRILKIIVA